MAALYHIAGEPEKYIPALRQEFEQVLAEGPKEGGGPGELTKQMLGKLVKMDSVLLESARLDPPQMGMSGREVYYAVNTSFANQPRQISNDRREQPRSTV